MRRSFEKVQPRIAVEDSDWMNWHWQMQKSLRAEKDFSNYFELSESEKQGFRGGSKLFRFQSTPYYASLAHPFEAKDPIRRIMLPEKRELSIGLQEQKDPLGENKNRPAKRIIHRYSDRALFLVTDNCSVYCRYCTRKHFTGQSQALPTSNEYDEALSYIKKTVQIREVILSGGDPMTLSDKWVEKILTDLRSIPHVEIIRIGTRMPVVCPMRVTPSLVKVIKKYHPVYIMTHFNHPREITFEAAEALELMVDNGIPVFNQMVLLNGINNHAAIVQALSRRLLFLRVKPYYMFQCDPSQGSDHLRTSVEQSKQIQRELWGHLSGLAMPNLSLDLPDGGGKVGIVPDFNERVDVQGGYSYTGWDGIEATYMSPNKVEIPADAQNYSEEWEALKSGKENRFDGLSHHL